MAVLLVPGLVLGHAELDTPTPADKSTVTDAGRRGLGHLHPGDEGGRQHACRQGLVGGGPSPRAASIPTDDKRMVATPATPLGTGTYQVEWTSTRRGQRGRARDLDLHRGDRGAAVPHSGGDRRGVRRSNAPQSPRRAERRPPHRPDPARRPADGSSHGSGSDVLLPIIVALIVLGAGAAYLLSRRNRPPDPSVIRDGLGRLAVRVSGVARARDRPRRLPARRRSRHTRSTRPTRAGCHWRSTWSGRPRRSPCRSSSSSSATCGRRRPTWIAEGSLPPAWLRYTLRAHRPDRLGLDHRPGDRRELERRRRRDALPVGLRLGRAGDHLRDGRTGLALPRSVLDPPRHRRRAPAPAGRPGLGDRRLPGAPRSLAGRHRLRVLRLARARRLRRPVDAVHRARRLHRAHPGDDGPVRARRMALARRDLHGLVPDPRPARPLATGRRGGARPSRARSGAACSSPAGRRPT